MEIKKIKKESYPYLLKQISQLTDEMDYIGEIPPDDNKFLCVVGSRTYSLYGKEACFKIIAGLKGYPIVIVSGLAVGIDSMAHEAALEAGLKTIAFPGSGLEESAIYPHSKIPLAKKIVKAGGALISKFPADMLSKPWSFPARNRLMAGISHAVLVIEGRQGSGTLGTADYAAEFNRDVFAVPGNIFTELSYGPNMLIQRGAAMITSSEDVLRELGFEVKTNKKKAGEEKNSAKKQLSINLDELALSPNERMICDYLKIENMSATDLIEKTSLSSSLFNIIISELEMKNLVIESGGSYRMRNV
ncbi:MAG: DNA-processing protein DprA [Patescibacteria group bacterium]